MITEVTTESGAKYFITDETWVREGPGSLRSDSGTIEQIYLKYGEEMVIVGPPLESGDFRVIRTTTVVCIKTPPARDHLK
jgi:hypothetical protein